MTKNKTPNVPDGDAAPATAAMPATAEPAVPAAAEPAAAEPAVPATPEPGPTPSAGDAAAAPDAAGTLETPETWVPVVPGAAAKQAGSAPTAEPAGGRIKIDMPVDGRVEPMRPATRMPKLATDSAAAEPTSTETAATEPAPTDAAGETGQDVFVESSPTTMLQVRPPQEEVDRRLAAREQAANTKPVLPRVFQVLMAVFYPVVLLVLAIRLVTSNIFLWIEYHRPGFPADSFGFSTDDRVTYGSYTVDYLLNFAGPRYLGGLVNGQGAPLFLEREVAHMADVKSLIDLAFLLGLVLAIVMVIGIIYLSRRSVGGVRRGLFAGSIATLVLVIALGVLAFMGWETFFADFHKIFFANGTWTFYTDDTLIRLFPSDFWSDAGIFIGAFVLVVSSLTLAFTWPTKDRRHAVARAKRPGRRTATQ